MSDWSDAGWPGPRISGYGYGSDAGLVRSPIPSQAPRQVRAYTQRPRPFRVSYPIPVADLHACETWIYANGYTWHTQDLVSGDSGGVGPVAHTVRFTGPLVVSLLSSDIAQIDATLEQAAADETCALVANADLYTACLGTESYPDTIGVDWGAIADAWGTVGDPW